MDIGKIVEALAGPEAEATGQRGIRIVIDHLMALPPRSRRGREGKWQGAHRSWVSLKQRCLNPKDASYPDYGGRGITICDRWLHSFENFYADMGERPKGLSLDRIDNDGHYEPVNCRWATPLQQSRNRRPRRFFRRPK